MFVKITSGNVAKYPYTVGDLRRDNPNVSFPRNVPSGVMQRYGMFPVATVADPDHDPLTQKIVSSDQPVKEISAYYTAENAPMPDMVGEPIYTGRWIISKSVVELTADEIAANTEAAASIARRQRDRLLLDTDWVVVMHTEKGTNIPLQWEVYRQALRDITVQEGFPHSVTWPEKP